MSTLRSTVHNTGAQNKMVESFMKTMRFSNPQEASVDSMRQLRSGEIDAICVENLIPIDSCEKIIEQLEGNKAGFEVTEFPGPFRSFFYGRNLNLNEPDLAEYFHAAADFRDKLSTLSDRVGVNPLELVLQFLSTSDSNRIYRVAPGSGSQTYFGTTFRGHLPGGYIPAHFDNEQVVRPSYNHLRQHVLSDTFSFVLTIGEAEQGGYLEVFDLVAPNIIKIVENDDSFRRKPDLSLLKSEIFPMRAGGLMVLRSGSRLHRVVPVEGNKTRWTMCSFMADSNVGNLTYTWG
jgi:hypothetical protein